jgi:hypothetical protein
MGLLLARVRSPPRAFEAGVLREPSKDEHGRGVGRSARRNRGGRR